MHQEFMRSIQIGPEKVKQDVQKISEFVVIQHFLILDRISETSYDIE